MKKALTILTILLLGVTSARAQTSLSFYHLGNATFQNSNFNPAFIPEGKVFFGLPALSGVHVNYNNRFSYKELVNTNEETGNPKIDLRKGLKNMNLNNMVSTHVGISLLHVGFRTQSGTAFSLFANERIETDILFDKKVMKFAIRGNGSALDQKVEVGKTRASMTHFREYGIGVALPSPNVDLVMGARLKYLQGFLNASTPENQSAYISTDGETYILNGNFENAMLRTSGIRLAKDGEVSHFISNNNRGMAVDLGFNWEMDKYNAFSVSLTDLGWISWKDDTKHYSLSDTSFNYSGINLRSSSNIEETVQDSLLDKFDIQRSKGNYSTLIGPKLYASWTYHTPYEGGDVVTSFGTRYIQRKMKVMMGVGYRQRFGKWFVGSLNVTKLPQQFFNLGTAVALKGGPAQFYLAVDQLYNFDATKFQSLDFRVGVNFIFGARESELKSNSSKTTVGATGPSKKLGPKYHEYQSFMGQEVEVKRHEGIYAIIPLQKRRKKEEYMKSPPEE